MGQIVREFERRRRVVRCCPGPECRSRRLVPPTCQGIGFRVVHGRCGRSALLPLFICHAAVLLGAGPAARGGELPGGTSLQLVALVDSIAAGGEFNELAELCVRPGRVAAGPALMLAAAAAHLAEIAARSCRLQQCVFPSQSIASGWHPRGCRWASGSQHCSPAWLAAQEGLPATHAGLVARW